MVQSAQYVYPKEPYTVRVERKKKISRRLISAYINELRNCKAYLDY